MVKEKTFQRLIPQGIHCTFTLRQTGVSHIQDLVPHITLIELVRINIIESQLGIQ